MLQGAPGASEFVRMCAFTSPASRRLAEEGLENLSPMPFHCPLPCVVNLLVAFLSRRVYTIPGDGLPMRGSSDDRRAMSDSAGAARIRVLELSSLALSITVRWAEGVSALGNASRWKRPRLFNLVRAVPSEESSKTDRCTRIFHPRGNMKAAYTELRLTLSRKDCILLSWLRERFFLLTYFSSKTWDDSSSQNVRSKRDNRDKERHGSLPPPSRPVPSPHFPCAQSPLPRTPEEAANLLTQGLARGFHVHRVAASHAPTDFERWAKESRNTTGGGALWECLDPVTSVQMLVAMLNTSREERNFVRSPPPHHNSCSLWCWAPGARCCAHA